MANELSISITHGYTKGNASLPSRTVATNVTVTGTVFVDSLQSIGTSEETIALGEVATPLVGYLYLRNCDATNFVEVGNATGAYQIKLKAGQQACLPLDSWDGIYAKANTGAVLLQYRLTSE